MQKENEKKAMAVLKELSKRKRLVHVMVRIDPLCLTFKTTVKKDDGGYFLSMSGLRLGLIPGACDLLKFPDNGGLLMANYDSGAQIYILPDLQELQDVLERFNAKPTPSTRIH
jgi:hypothetical protein